MAEYIKKDYHYSTRYALIKNGERIEFNSEKDAEFQHTEKLKHDYIKFGNQ